jgi:hypothetical protein
MSRQGEVPKGEVDWTFFCWRFMFFHVEFYFLCFLACHRRSRQPTLSATAGRLELIMGGKKKEGTFH